MNRKFLFAVFLLVSRTLFAAEDTQTGFRVVQERSADGVTLIMKSDYCVEFTVTLETTLTNMTSSRPVPFTVDAGGRSSFVLARFKQADKSRPWRYNYYYHWEYGGRRNSTTNDADYAMPFGLWRGEDSNVFNDAAEIGLDKAQLNWAGEIN